MAMAQAKSFMRMSLSCMSQSIVLMMVPSIPLKEEAQNSLEEEKALATTSNLATTTILRI